MRSLTDAEKRFVEEAAQYLESPHFIHRVSQVIGVPLEKSMKLLPASARTMLTQVSQRAIESALKASLVTINNNRPTAVTHGFDDSVSTSKKTKVLHGLSSALTGAASGFFGLPALAIELPLTTTLMMRSIAKIAADFGEDVQSRQTQLECLYVFSLGSPADTDDQSDSAYYASRLMFSQMITQAMGFLAGKSSAEIARAVEKKAAPVLLEFILRVASRFEIVVSRKALGQLLPGIGAGVGAILNAAFTEHFDKIATYHFGLRRLERECGPDAIRELYRRSMPRT